MFTVTVQQKFTKSSGTALEKMSLAKKVVSCIFEDLPSGRPHDFARQSCSLRYCASKTRPSDISRKLDQTIRCKDFLKGCFQGMLWPWGLKCCKRRLWIFKPNFRNTKLRSMNLFTNTFRVKWALFWHSIGIRGGPKTKKHMDIFCLMRAAKGVLIKLMKLINKRRSFDAGVVDYVILLRYGSLQDFSLIRRTTSFIALLTGLWPCTVRYIIKRFHHHEHQTILGRKNNFHARFFPLTIEMKDFLLDLKGLRNFDLERRCELFKARFGLPISHFRKRNKYK